MGNSVEETKTKEVILPIKSCKFLKSIGNKKEINPYLAQNRFSCKITSVNKRNNKKTIRYESLLYEIIKSGKIQDKKFCNGKLVEIAERLNERNQKLAGHFSKHGSYLYKPYDKMMIGEGGAFYLGMLPLKLHSLYGLPYIPASAIKGALRSACMIKKSHEDPSKAMQEQDFIKLFGNAEADSDHTRGELVFFDIFPENFLLGLDVQTPHFKTYYDSNEEPRDDIAPVPIYFVCLRKSTFKILIACRNEELWKKNKDKIDVSMNMVFTQLGIGAKGSLGYGTV